MTDVLVPRTVAAVVCVADGLGAPVPVIGWRL
jgi:hypothetical protein